MSKSTDADIANGVSAPAPPTDPMPSTPVHTPSQIAGYPPDQYTGLGGDYVRDPATGIRSPATAAQ